MGVLVNRLDQRATALRRLKVEQRTPSTPNPLACVVRFVIIQQLLLLFLEHVLLPDMRSPPGRYSTCKSYR